MDLERAACPGEASVWKAEGKGHVGLDTFVVPLWLTVEGFLEVPKKPE